MWLPSLEMEWKNVYFITYQADTKILQESLPRALELEQFQGKSYLSIVGFCMENIRAKGMPTWSGLSFTEINIRTYVRDKEGRKGIFFYTLDADDFIGVHAGTVLTGLPYRYTDTHLCRIGNRIHTKNIVRKRKTFEAVLDVGTKIAEPSSLTHFLCERYRFFTESKGNLYTGTVKHRPWSVWQTTIDIKESEYVKPFVYRYPLEPHHVVFSDGVEVISGQIEKTA